MAIKNNPASKTKILSTFLNNSETFECFAKVTWKEDAPDNLKTAKKANLDLDGKNGEGGIVAVSFSLDYDNVKSEFSLVQKGEGANALVLGPFPTAMLPEELLPDAVVRYDDTTHISQEAASDAARMLMQMVDEIAPVKKTTLPGKRG